MLRIVDWIRAADFEALIVETDRGRLVVREVTRAQGAEEPHGLDMKQIAVEKVFSEAEGQAADKQSGLKLNF